MADIPTLPAIDAAAVLASDDTASLGYLIRVAYWQANLMAHFRGDDDPVPEWDIQRLAAAQLAQTIAVKPYDIKRKLEAALFLLRECDGSEDDEANRILDSLEHDFEAMSRIAVERYVESGAAEQRQGLVNKARELKAEADKLLAEAQEMDP